MPASTAKDSTEGLQGLIENLQKNEKSALDAMKRFAETVNDVFPDISEDGPRQKIIDSAFQMTEEVVNASNRMAINVVDVLENALKGLTDSSEKSGKS